MKLTTNSVDELKEARELLEVLGEVEKKAQSLKDVMGFYTIRDVMKLTGLSEPRVQALFNRDGFPVCDYGRRKIVSIRAFWNYFDKAVKVSDEV